MLKLLARGVACFFLVMAVLEPLLQIGAQHLGWSSGLSIEVGFFVPAGLAWTAHATTPSASTSISPRAAASSPGPS